MASTPENFTPDEMLDEVKKAIYTVLVGGQAYSIGSRSMTRADLSLLKSMRDDLEAQVATGANTGLTPLAIPRLAEGGIATSATLAMIGEGNESEAVLPLSKLSAMLDTPKANNSTTDEDYTVVFAPVQNFYGSVSKTDVEQANTASFEQFKRWYDKMEADKRRKCFAPGLKLLN